ncbi:MAG: hypothetical protein VXY99_16335 [Pseudomonadota bacterium]|nr:hypothetical protein [Pseudomonadota bacterium]MEC8485386.1 hypothetical protein [Pseudomonadota bacterium]
MTTHSANAIKPSSNAGFDVIDERSSKSITAKPESHSHTDAQDLDSQAKATANALVRAIELYSKVPAITDSDFVRLTAVAGRCRRNAELLAEHCRQWAGVEEPGTSTRNIPWPGTKSFFKKTDVWYQVYHYLDKLADDQDIAEVPGLPTWHLSWSVRTPELDGLEHNGECIFPNGPQPGKSVSTTDKALAVKAQRAGYNVVGPGVVPPIADGHTLTFTYIDGTYERVACVTPADIACICEQWRTHDHASGGGVVGFFKALAKGITTNGHDRGI